MEGLSLPTLGYFSSEGALYQKRYWCQNMTRVQKMNPGQISKVQCVSPSVCKLRVQYMHARKCILRANRENNDELVMKVDFEIYDIGTSV